MPVFLELKPRVSFQEIRGVALANEQYNLRFRWNDTDQAWYMDVRDFEGRPIATSLKLVLGTYVGRHCAHVLFQSGAFFLVDTTREGREAGFDDISERVILSYWTAGELNAQLLAEDLGEA